MARVSAAGLGPMLAGLRGRPRPRIRGGTSRQGGVPAARLEGQWHLAGVGRAVAQPTLQGGGAQDLRRSPARSGLDLEFRLRSPLLRRAFAAASAEPAPAAVAGGVQAGGAVCSTQRVAADETARTVADADGAHRDVASRARPSLAPSRQVNEYAGIMESLKRAASLGTKMARRVLEMCRRLGAKSKSLAKAFLKNPRIVAVWYKDIRDATVHFCTWVATGFRLFWQDLRTAFYLAKRVLRGFPLKVRERKLLVRTTSDCLKLIPFSFFIIVPFAEVLLPFALRLFPNMLPSSFFDKRVDNATLARKFKAKQELAEFWQQVVEQRTKELSLMDSHIHSDRAAELNAFQAKLIEAKEFPTLKEILRFSKIFADEMQLQNMTTKQLLSMSRLLGLSQSQSVWRSFLEVQLRHHIVSIRQEDRDYLWEGIDGFTHMELIEACTKRAIRVSGVDENEMRQNLSRWLELSAHRQIPTSLLLWVQSFYLVHDKLEAGDFRAASDAQSLQMDVQSATLSEAEEAQEVFSNMADRQAAKASNLERNLKELCQEIEEVVDRPAAGEAAGAAATDSAKVSEATIGKGIPSISLSDEEAETGEPDWTAERKQRAKVLKRLRELDEKVHLYKEVMGMQKKLLDQQLQFLNSMRANASCQQRDPDTILLDQRVRLMEMIGDFETNYEEIDELMVNATPTRKPRIIRLQ